MASPTEQALLRIEKKLDHIAYILYTIAKSSSHQDLVHFHVDETDPTNPIVTIVPKK